MDEYKCKCDKRQRPYQSTLELTCKWMDLFVQLRGLHGTISITQRGERIVAMAGHATVLYTIRLTTCPHHLIVTLVFLKP